MHLQLKKVKVLNPQMHLNFRDFACKNKFFFYSYFLHLYFEVQVQCVNDHLIFKVIIALRQIISRRLPGGYYAI